MADDEVTKLEAEVAKLKARVAMLESAFDASPTPAQLFDADGVSWRMNAAQREFLGLESTDTGVGSFNVLTDPFSVESGNAPLFAKAYAGEEVVCPEMKVDLGAARERWGTVIREAVYQQQIHPIRAADGSVVGTAAYIEEMTAMRIIERTVDELLTANAELAESREAAEKTAAELAELAVALERSNHDLEQFAFAASHDLREPLRTIAGFSKLLADELGPQLSSSAKEDLHFVQDGVERMKRLIDDLLDYSRVGKSKLELTSVSLATVLERVRSDVRAAIDEADAEIIVAPDLPHVDGDLGQLARLFENLVINAIKYCRVGVTPKIEFATSAQGGEVRVSVRDNGVGIESRFLSEVFTPFRRVHGSELAPGSGLGLSIVARVAEAHGGRVEVESVVGQGSCFHVWLRAVGAPA